MPHILYNFFLIFQMFVVISNTFLLFWNIVKIKNQQYGNADFFPIIKKLANELFLQKCYY